MPTIDDSAARVAQTLTPPLRALCLQLPWHLGLTPEPDGRWEDFVRIEPNRDLPRFALAALGGATEFSEAHRCAAIWGLIADRVADRQVARAMSLVELRATFRQQWEAHLARGFGDRVRARAAVCRALRSWRLGLRLEREQPEGPLPLARYFSSIVERLRWVTTSACAAVDASGAPDRAAALERGYLGFLVALQLRDDALDADEDAALHGESIPARLGLAPAAMHAAAPFVVRAASRALRAQDFVALGEHLDDFAARIERPVASSEAMAAAMGAVLLTSGAADVLGLGL